MRDRQYRRSPGEQVTSLLLVAIALNVFTRVLAILLMKWLPWIALSLVVLAVAKLWARSRERW